MKSNIKKLQGDLWRAAAVLLESEGDVVRAQRVSKIANNLERVEQELARLGEEATDLGHSSDFARGVAYAVTNIRKALSTETENKEER